MDAQGHAVAAAAIKWGIVEWKSGGLCFTPVTADRSLFF